MSLSTPHCDNFKTLCAAFRKGDAVLLECQSVATGEPVPVICAVNSEQDGSRSLVPFAQLFPDDPYRLINPPHPDGPGFFTQQEVWSGR